MEIRLGSEALKDLEYLKSVGNHKILKRIALLIKSIKLTPFKGIGKPEPLNPHCVLTRRKFPDC